MTAFRSVSRGSFSQVLRNNRKPRVRPSSVDPSRIITLGIACCAGLMVVVLAVAVISAS